MNNPKFNIHKPQTSLRKRKERGSVLVVCIGVLAIISLLAVVFITSMRVQQDIGSNLKNVSKAQIAARAGTREIAVVDLRHAIAKPYHQIGPRGACDPYLVGRIEGSLDDTGLVFQTFVIDGNGPLVHGDRRRR